MAWNSLYTVTPTTLYFSAVPGQEVENVVQIQNAGTEPLTFDIKTTGIKIIDAVGHIRRSSTSSSIASWISFKKQTVTLAPEEKQFISFKLAVPENTAAGSYSGAFDFVLTSSIVKIEKGTVIHVDVGQKLLTRLRLLDFKQRLITRDFGRDVVQLQLVNAGSNIAQPVGQMTVAGLAGQNLATIPVRNTLIAPHSSWDNSYQVPVNIPGIYQIQLQLSYNHGLNGVRADTWVVSPILLMAFMFSAIAGVIVLSIHHHKKWRLRRKK